MERAGRSPDIGTYCYKLWDSAYIVQTGDVFVCCHELPGVIGNIFQDHMSAIWTGPQLDKFRRHSLSGVLDCAPRCNILSAEQKAGIRRPRIYLEHPIRLHLLYGELCNIRCIMCPQDHLSKIALDNETLRNNIDWTKVKEVELQGGEILAIKGAKDFYEWVTSHLGLKVNLITNGLLINESWADRLVLNANWIQISVNAATKATHELVNAGSRFEKVIDNMRALVSAKVRHRSKAQIIYKFTAVVENVHEMGRAVELAHELGCDGIAFGYERTVPAFLGARPGLVQELRQQFATLLGGNLPLKVERIRLQYLGIIDRPTVA